MPKTGKAAQRDWQSRHASRPKEGGPKGLAEISFHKGLASFSLYRILKAESFCLLGGQRYQL
jgi:hypothetical protein